MAYSPAALKLIAGNGWEFDAPRIWSYKTTDTMTTARAANYFADARLRGMQAGDYVLVQVVNGSNVAQTSHLAVALTVGATGADLTDGVAITLTNS